MTFQLSSSLDREAIHQHFVEHGYVHIRDVLPAENAQRLRKTLLEGTPWNLAFNDRDRHIDISPAQLAVMPVEKVRELQNAIYAQAQQGFQYCYNNYPIFDAVKAGENEGHLLHQFYEWLNEDEFLEFGRAVSGYDDVSFVDAQATRYKPGHFLSTHDDTLDNKNRRAAYIFNFTDDWVEDWGGYLQLFDDDGHMRHGIKPVFNSLNIIRIPQRHNVAIVSPFAAGMRISVSGWLRFGDPE